MIVSCPRVFGKETGLHVLHAGTGWQASKLKQLVCSLWVNLAGARDAGNEKWTDRKKNHPTGGSYLKGPKPGLIQPHSLPIASGTRLRLMAWVSWC